jgi:type II secretory pathway pseudopilin PulG
MHPQYRSYSGLDRAALRLGIALVSWSRRTRHATVDREQQQLEHERQRAILEYRDTALRNYYSVNR